MAHTAQQTLNNARKLQAALRTKGHEVSLKEAYDLARAAQSINESVDADLKRQARAERKRKADVAGWCDDMRKAGAYDGE